VLGLLFNQIDDEAARLLCERPFFQRLTLIRCGANPLSEDGRALLRDHFGERVSFTCERDEDQLYAFQDDEFTAGFGRDRTQLLLYGTDTELRAALFDHAGNLLSTRRRTIRHPKGATWEQRRARRDKVRETWLKKLGYQSATIKVKRFQFDDGAGVRDFSWWQQAFDRADHPQREGLDGAIWGWVRDGQFEYNFGGDNVWLDRTGLVTDT
jgi:hypothetical protein